MEGSKVSKRSSEVKKFDKYVLSQLGGVQSAVEAEMLLYPAEQYPARGTVLISLARRLGEVVGVASRLPEFPPDDPPITYTYPEISS